MLLSHIYVTNLETKGKIFIKTINDDLYDIYQAKMEAMSKKHFSKDLKDVQFKLQSVVNWLEKEYISNRSNKKNGNDDEVLWFFLGTKEFTRADVVVTAFLNWLTVCNERVGAAPIHIPDCLKDYLEKAKTRPSFHKAIGQYKEDAFVLTMARQKNRIIGRVLLGVIVSSVLGLVGLRYYNDWRSWIF